ncbi:MAG: hypothetical protein ABIG95_04850 [Candidatus Woesearchaeota archaeon]
MDFNKILLIGSIIVCGYILLRLMRKPNYEFQEQYQNILTSEEFKVKGQFEE